MSLFLSHFLCQMADGKFQVAIQSFCQPLYFHLFGLLGRERVIFLPAHFRGIYCRVGSAKPDLDTADDRLYTIPGSPPNLLHEKQGDAFAPRNHFALNIDDEVDPPMFKISDTHYAATWLLDPRAPKVDMPPELAQRIARMRAEAEKIKEAE